MNMKEIKELLDLVVDKGFTEFELERSGIRLRLKRDTGRPDSGQLVQGPVISYAPIVAPVGAAPQQPALAAAESATAPAAPATPATPPAEKHYQVKSPIVGTYYDSPSPEAAPFVSIGSHVQKGQVLCILEAMKLMNEIESDIAGTVMDRLVTNGTPVEYGQPLFAIKPD